MNPQQAKLARKRARKKREVRATLQTVDDERYHYDLWVQHVRNSKYEPIPGHEMQRLIEKYSK